MPNFNWEISLGTLISLATVIFAAGGFYAFAKNLGNNMTTLTTTFTKQVDDIKEDLKSLNKVIMDVAVQNKRIDNLEERNNSEIAHLKEDIRDLKHGDGFIKKSA